MFDLLLQPWYFVDHHIPHDLIVYSEICMDKPVSDTSHGTPFEVVVFLPEIVRELPRRFANDFETPHKSPLQCFILQELFLAQFY
jgi:hypothetical protein